MHASVLFALSACCGIPPGLASADQLTPQGLTEHRLTLAADLLGRFTDADEQQELMRELDGFYARLLKTRDDELPRDAEAFLVRVMKRYRARPERDDTARVERARGQYEQKLEQLDSIYAVFVESLPPGDRQPDDGFDPVAYKAHMEAATKAASQGRFDEAGAAVEAAYRLVVIGLKSLRDNETVEYRLDFASAEEEYRYDIRRFENQQLLLDMVLAERSPSEAAIRMIADFVDRATTLRDEAVVLAAAGDFLMAVEVQERAVGQLTRALRVAGLQF